MTSNLLKLCLVLCLGALTSARVWARENIQIEFQAVTWGAPIKDLFFRAAGKTISLPVFPLKAGLSATFSYSGPPQLEFFRKTISDTGAISYSPAGPVKIDATVHKKFLVLFTPPIFGADLSAPLSAIALPNDADGFANGQLRIANCTPVPVAIRCNQQVVELPAGAVKIISPDSLQVRLEMAAWNGTSWKIIATTYLPLSADSRLNAFVYLGGRLGEENPVPPAPGEPISARDFSIITLADVAKP